MSKQAVQNDWLRYKRLLSYVLRHWQYFALSIVGFWIFNLSQIALADLMQFIVDSIAGEVNGRRGIVTTVITYFEGGEINIKNSNQWIVGIVFVLGLIRGVGFFIGNYSMAYVARYLVHYLRCDIFDHLLAAPSKEYDTHSSSKLISRIIFNVEQVTGAATNALKVMIKEGIFVIGIISYLMYKDWRLSLFFLLAFPFIAVLVSWVGKKFRKISKRIQDSMGSVTQVSTESINAYKEVRVYGGNEIERKRFYEASNTNRLQNMRLAFYNAISPPIIQQPVVIVLCAMIWFALGFLSSMSPGEFIAYLAVAMLLPKPLRQLSEVYSTIQKGLAAAEDIFDFLDAEEEKDLGDYAPEQIAGEIEFLNVGFSYTEGGAPVLNDINFKVLPGQTIALVGLSGSGKSTIVNLLTRFYNHESGQLLIDGRDVNDYKLCNLRKHIALVTQNVQLFDDTIFNNIAYGEMNAASRENVIKAATAAHAMEFINDLPSGLDTQVGEGGALLSGGQRQRIAIARALLKDAPILVLDEATSALDNKAEFYIQEALNAIMKGRTTIVIAHRLSTIENADLILVLEAGSIIERGNHDQLIEHSGRYAELYNRQFTD